MPGFFTIQLKRMSNLYYLINLQLNKTSSGKTFFIKIDFWR